MKPIIMSLLLTPGLLVLATTAVSAHVKVTPNSVGVASEQVFSISVPSERDASTVSLRLLVPSGVTDVMPTVKPGWTVSVKMNGDTPREIDWTGGSIPAEQRDDFSFGAQVPGTVQTLAWKAYQTYSDGVTVSWDKTPDPKAGDDASGNSGPYSETKVINDLTAQSNINVWQQVKDYAGIAGLVLAAVAIGLSIRKQ